MNKISIITAVLNRRSTIGSAIRSVQSQTYYNIEHIIQDGGSTDGTLDIIKQTMNSSTSFVSEPDCGIYDAINRGIERASGDIIGLMHSDDVFHNPMVISKVASAFADPKVDLVYGDLEYVSPNNLSKVVRHWVAGEYHPTLLKRGWMPPHPTLYLRRSVFDEYGSYDCSLQIAADYDAILRFLGRANLKIVYIPEVLVKMRLGGESNRSLKRIIRKSLEDLIAIRRNGVGGMMTLLLKNLRKLPQFF